MAPVAMESRMLTVRMRKIRGASKAPLETLPGRSLSRFCTVGIIEIALKTFKYGPRGPGRRGLTFAEFDAQLQLVLHPGSDRPSTAKLLRQDERVGAPEPEMRGEGAHHTRHAPVASADDIRRHPFSEYGVWPLRPPRSRSIGESTPEQRRSVDR